MILNGCHPILLSPWQAIGGCATGSRNWESERFVLSQLRSSKRGVSRALPGVQRHHGDGRSERQLGCLEHGTSCSCNWAHVPTQNMSQKLCVCLSQLKKMAMTVLSALKSVLSSKNWRPSRYIHRLSWLASVEFTEHDWL